MPATSPIFCMLLRQYTYYSDYHHFCLQVIQPHQHHEWILLILGLTIFLIVNNKQYQSTVVIDLGQSKLHIIVYNSTC